MTTKETAPAPEILKAMATETEQIEISREVNDEEKANIRCQNKPEEVLEAKSLPGIISAYLKYFLFLTSFLLNLLSFSSLVELCVL